MIRPQMMRVGCVLGLAWLLSGCSSSTFNKVLNPLAVEPEPEAFLGTPDSSALDGTTSKAEEARAALEAMTSYQRQFTPSPNKPVMRPAVVRLMWVPDHLSPHGDLVPAHYFYLKVKDDEWAVTDAYDLYDQLDGSAGKNANPSNIPFVTDKKR